MQTYFGVNKTFSMAADEAKALNPELTEIIDKLAKFNDHCDETYYFSQLGFEYLGHGAWKECFANDKYIVKFVSQDNETEEEMRILAQAEAEEVPCFAPSVYLPMNGNYMTFLDEDRCDEGEDQCWDEEADEYVTNPDYQAPSVAWVVIQEKVCPAEEYYHIHNREYDSYNCWDYEDILDNDGFVTEFGLVSKCKNVARFFDKESWKRFPVSDYSMLDTVEWFYNESGITKLINFIKDNNISDLHEGNYGYDKYDRPVIFDWLS